MVITEINSGLGNQMFQYAAGLSLASALNKELKLNIEWYRNTEVMQTPRKYDLGAYALPEQIATLQEIDALTKPSASGIFNRLKHRSNRNRPPHRHWVYEEQHFHFDPDFFNAKSPVMLSGYWQSEKYFLPVADQVSARFIIKDIPGDKNAEWERLIRTSESVSLHVRRGDMVSNPDVARVHGSCDLDYYREAVRRISEGLESPVFFIFSDDPDWCKKNLEINYPTHFIDNNVGDLSYLDLQLMRLCRHNIIANSSFSWWGAWLNRSGDKKVISPLRWFNNKPHDTSDLIPANWMRI